MVMGDSFTFLYMISMQIMTFSLEPSARGSNLQMPAWHHRFTGSSFMEPDWEARYMLSKKLFRDSDSPSIGAN
jgi:hypothetical protein